jgi:hypothetical protein
MKLFVDDLRIAPEGWVVARTNTDAIDILHNYRVEEVSIDHDIKQTKYCGIDLETFLPVVYYIAIMDKAVRPKTIRIHTANPAGAMRMSSILNDASILCDVEESQQPFPKTLGGL